MNMDMDMDMENVWKFLSSSYFISDGILIGRALVGHKETHANK